MNTKTGSAVCPAVAPAAHCSAVPGTPPLLEIRQLTKTFATQNSASGQPAVDNVSLTLHTGEIFALLGPSGCGKSTLLRLLAGFEQPDCGQILLDGVALCDLPPYRRPINMMFQSYALFPHLTVEQNIAFGLKQEKLGKDDIARRVADMLSLVQMSDYARRKPDQLSGGQRQRVALARSLAKRPRLLLLDEPMTALDKKLREQMQMEVVAILRRVGVTCIIVTHDQQEAMSMATRIAIMHNGKLIQTGTPEDIYEQPVSRYSAEFIGLVNVFQGRCTARQHDGLLLTCPMLEQPLKLVANSVLPDDAVVNVALRPEKIQLDLAPPDNTAGITDNGMAHRVDDTFEHALCNCASGTVVHVSYLGDLSLYHVRLASGQTVKVQKLNTSRQQAAVPGSRVCLRWEPASCIMLKDEPALIPSPP